MKSIDTNVFLYAINSDCPEHQACRAMIGTALAERDGWIIAEQVWFELYRLLRNPSVLTSPLTAMQAADTIAWYRSNSGWLHCAWEPEMMKNLHRHWSDELFPSRRSFDLILALTLKTYGVRDFYTRNVRDFDDFGLFAVHDPLEAR